MISEDPPNDYPQDQEDTFLFRPRFGSENYVCVRSPSMGSPRACGGRVSSENRKGAGPTRPLAGSLCLPDLGLHKKAGGAGEAGLWSAQGPRSAAFQPVTNHLYMP